MSSKDLLKNLIWPAVAGNVAWGFFTVLLSEELQLTTLLGRLTALFLLSVYLIITYIRSDEGEGKKIDFAFAIAIILCAISIQANVPKMKHFLILLFLIAATGHWIGRWIPTEVTSNRKWKMFGVGCIHLIGAILCFFLPEWANTNLSISMFVVLLAWLIFRNKIYK